MSIPKVIHYCWFGHSQKGEKEQRCIESWKKFCPDYKIIEWNEDNYDINSHPFVSNAYVRKKWAFVSDFARLDIIYQYGGVYLDTDVEIIKPIDDLLSVQMYAGFEDVRCVNLGLGFGAEKKHPYIKEMMEAYDTLSFPDNDADLMKIACPIIQTDVLKNHGLVPNGESQKIMDCSVYSIDYFSPKSFETGIITLTANTYSIHHFNMSWFSKDEQWLRNKEWVLIDKYKKCKLIARILIFPDKLRFRYKQNGIKGVFKHLKFILHNVIHKDSSS